VLRALPWALRRRRVIQASRRSSIGAFASGLTASLDSPYLGSPPRPLTMLQASYWRGVRGLLGGASG
jgi:hypothetical protein